jgi:GT2 family glycosyltransferase/tetratricopeptide (TPR) repeat protein
MALKYLVGPVSARRAEEAWTGPRLAGVCKAFNASGDLDLAIGPNDSWDDALARLPPDWRPDLVLLEPAYRCIPTGLWRAPVPLVALAADWNLLWHGYRHLLPACDCVLTDSAGVEVMRRQGWTHVRKANLYGPERAFLEMAVEESPRDIDVLFVGNLHAAVQRSRLPWLGRLARLATRYNGVIRTGVYGEDYRALLKRARIVFNRSIRGECNQRTFEAAAAGALLLQEADNREVAEYFEPGREYVAYSDDNLEQLIDHYLTHDDERCSIARAARSRVQDYGTEALWGKALARLESEWDDLQARAAARQVSIGTEQLLSRSWQALSAGSGSDATLLADLETALSSGAATAALHNAAGLVAAQSGRGPQAAGRHFRAALECDPRHPVVALNLIECLVEMGQRELASEGARRLLNLLALTESLDAKLLDAAHYPAGFDLFRVEWERAAWENAGKPAGEACAKTNLLRWRLHDLLAGLSGDLGHFHEAALARPDLPSGRGKLGCALARLGRASEAIPHLRSALTDNPFDGPAARALAQALTDAGDQTASHRLARDRRLLHKAAPQAVPAEAWFAEAPPVGDELASIIILCHNEVEYTRLCLESLLAWTRSPYELIVVDNGSTDGTPGYLEEIRQRSGPARVVVIRNEENRGFPGGCNQGLAVAGGQYVVLLNNDTVLTEGWLDTLIRRSLSDWPKVGMVGPMTNSTRAPQQVNAGYKDLAGLPAFAAWRRQEFAGKVLPVERLTGFCLLIRREVLERIGVLDETFGTGFFEDDDLSVRVLRAGYRLLVAQDVYIHHFGSRTFSGMGLDVEKELQEKFGQFHAKWGQQHSAGYRLPDGSPLPAAATDAAPTVVVQPARTARARVTLCLIVKNEESNLGDCLGSAADLVDEVIVVDTGSTDATKEIASRFGARVFDFPWCDSFAAARNESLRHATGDWIFWLDADDRLDEENRAKLRTLFAGLGEENAAYVLKCLCLPDAATGSSTVVDHVRLFRNRPDVRWTYRVHEQILPAIRKTGGAVRWSEVVIRHTGYQDPPLRRRKLERDLRILRMENSERPDDPFTLFNFGQVAQELGRHAEAIPLLRRSLEKSHPKDSIVRKLYALIAGCHRQLGQPAEALSACREGRVHYPDDAELLFVESILLREKGDLAGAEVCLRRTLSAPTEGHFASLDAGLRGYKARQNLAILCQQQGRPEEAEAHFRQVVAERPEFLPGWVGMAELFLAQKQWPQLEETAEQLASIRGGEVEAGLLRARGHLVRREFAECRSILEKAIAAAPRVLAPRLLLSHAYLQEGTDPDGAEGALLSVLELAPDNTEARNNLAVLRRDRERTRATADAVFSGNVGVAELYFSACRCDHPLRDYLPALVVLARECGHVTDVGTGIGLAAAAFLYGEPGRLLCVDRIKYPEVDRLQLLAGRTEFTFRQTDVLWEELEETDLLFLDTWRVQEQLVEELRLHGGKVRKYIVIHGTTAFADQGEDAGHRGLWPAVEAFLARGTFRIKEQRKDRDGLTILERVDASPASEETP